jgi:hypothetical protein
MRRICEDCGLTYDDYDHLTICPHQVFGFSDDVRKMIEAGDLPERSLDGDPREPTEAERLEWGS